MTDDARAVRALEDVVAVEEVAPGMARVCTWSDQYVVDARGEGCACPDKEYNDAPICKHEYAALMADVGRLPSPWVDETTADTPQVMTDGGQVVETWTVVNRADGNERSFSSRSDAEDAADTLRDLGGDPELVAPGEDADAPTDDDPEVVDAEPVDPAPEPATDAPDAGADLPERNVGDDPLTWMPGHFIDQIDGTPAINRKGFEVLAHHYDIDTHSDLEVPPEENGHEYVRVKATAVTDDGRTCEAYGSAHVDRGDDPELLLEMADTRARKRALSIATGVGVVAVEELRNEVDT